MYAKCVLHAPSICIFAFVSTRAEVLLVSRLKRACCNNQPHLRANKACCADAQMSGATWCRLASMRHAAVWPVSATSLMTKPSAASPAPAVVQLPSACAQTQERTQSRGQVVREPLCSLQRREEGVAHVPGCTRAAMAIKDAKEAILVAILALLELRADAQTLVATLVTVESQSRMARFALLQRRWAVHSDAEQTLKHAAAHAREAWVAAGLQRSACHTSAASAARLERAERGCSARLS